jgi:hypothetical protein
MKCFVLNQGASGQVHLFVQPAPPLLDTFGQIS